MSWTNSGFKIESFDVTEYGMTPDRSRETHLLKHTYIVFLREIEFVDSYQCAFTCREIIYWAKVSGKKNCLGRQLVWK